MSKSLRTLLTQRFGFGILALFAVSVLIFLGVEALPGDLAQSILGQAATPETVAALRAELGLDKPAHVRYLAWIGDFLRGDFGTSLANGRPIDELLETRLYNTMFLAVTAALFSIPIALALGVVAALYRESVFDKMISILTLLRCRDNRR